jgi:hypothetical protein
MAQNNLKVACNDPSFVGKNSKTQSSLTLTGIGWEGAV